MGYSPIEKLEADYFIARGKARECSWEHMEEKSDLYMKSSRIAKAIQGHPESTTPAWYEYEFNDLHTSYILIMAEGEIQDVDRIFHRLGQLAELLWHTRREPRWWKLSEKYNTNFIVSEKSKTNLNPSKTDQKP